MATLVIAEHDQQNLMVSTLSTLAAAVSLKEPVTVLVAGHQCESVAEKASRCQGVTEVIHFDSPAYTHPLAENLADYIVSIGASYEYILAPATTFGKNLMPRVAALLDVAQLSDITEVVDSVTFTRPIYAGSAFETIESLDEIKVMTVRPTAFPPVGENEQPAKINTDQRPIQNIRVEWLEMRSSEQERPDLSTAKIVISGGRGLANQENFKLVEDLADQLGAAVGASRAAVDAGFVPNDYQVGQTGKVVAPNLYIAIGISGAVQHLAGMKESKVIVAINNDPDAPIFSLADYGLVADLFEAIPQLQQELIKLGYPTSEKT